MHVACVLRAHLGEGQVDLGFSISLELCVIHTHSESEPPALTSSHNLLERRRSRRRRGEQEKEEEEEEEKEGRGQKGGEGKSRRCVSHPY